MNERINLYLPLWTTNIGKTPMNSNDSPDRTVRLNPALNNALVKNNNKLNKIV